jgi:hypothetical protein
LLQTLKPLYPNIASTEKKERTKMQIAKNKTTAIAIAIFLIISMGASMALIPNANAHTPAYQIKTYALVEAMPHTTGVGQTVVVYAFLGNAPPPGSTAINTYRFHNYTVIFVAPSGNTTTLHYDTIFDTTGAQISPLIMADKH